MTDTTDPVAEGYYARKQIYSGDPLVSWSHRRRFAHALNLARPFAGQRLLDYGCGDGSFLGLLVAAGLPPSLAVGAEIDDELVLDCRRRFSAYHGVRFVEMSSLENAEHAAFYDAIFCMEVLEHVVDPQPLLDDFERLLRPGGTLVISVPIETGVPVLLKQIARRVAGWRGVGNYPGTSSYTLLEMMKSLAAGRNQHIPRPVFTRSDGIRFHDHKGFNWRVLRATVASMFDLEHTVTSPFPWLGPALGTQVWFIARRVAR